MKAFITLLALFGASCEPSSSDSPPAPPSGPTSGWVYVEETYSVDPPCDEVDLLLWDITHFRGDLEPYYVSWGTPRDGDYLLIPIEPGEEYVVTISLPWIPWIDTQTLARFGTAPGLGSCFQNYSDPGHLLSPLNRDPANGLYSAVFVAPEAPVEGWELYLFLEIFGQAEPGISEPWTVSVERRPFGFSN